MEEQSSSTPNETPNETPNGTQGIGLDKSLQSLNWLVGLSSEKNKNTNSRDNTADSQPSSSNNNHTASSPAFSNSPSISSNSNINSPVPILNAQMSVGSSHSQVNNINPNNAVNHGYQVHSPNQINHGYQNQSINSFSNNPLNNHSNSYLNNHSNNHLNNHSNNHLNNISNNVPILEPSTSSHYKIQGRVKNQISKNSQYSKKPVPDKTFKTTDNLCAGKIPGVSSTQLPNLPNSLNSDSPGTSLSTSNCQYPKPAHSYAELINLAISSSERKMMTLSEIYNNITTQFPYFKTCQSRWKNSIRHNLSLNRNFIRVPRPKDESGKGSYWTLAKFRGSHAAALNELHQKQLANLSESFRQLYQETFQPALLSSGLLNDIMEGNGKGGNQVVVNPKAAQIAIKNEKEQFEKEQKRKDIEDMKSLGVGGLGLQLKNDRGVKTEPGSLNNTPIFLNNGIQGRFPKTSFFLENTPVGGLPVLRPISGIQGPNVLNLMSHPNADPNSNPIASKNTTQNANTPADLHPTIQSAYTEVERNLNKSVNLLRNKHWSKKDLEPYSDLMASMAKAEADKWDLTPNDLSTLYEGINKFCSDQSKNSGGKMAKAYSLEGGKGTEFY